MADLVLSSSTGTIRIAQNTTVFNNKTFGSTAFAGGFGGSGWRIDSEFSNESYMETDNLVVRGTMRVYELLISQIRATNGSLWVSAVGKVTSSVGAGPYTLYFDSASGTGHGFAVDDIIMAQRWDRSSNSIFRSVLEVTSTSNSSSLVANLVTGNAPASGYEYVRIGNLSDTDRQGSIYMTADDSGAPFIRIYDGVASWSNATEGSNFGDFETTKAQLGKLTNITDPAYGTLNGYGLYSQNVYLTGNANILGTLAVGGKSGSIAVGNTFYVGPISANKISRSQVLGASFLNGSGANPTKTDNTADTLAPDGTQTATKYVTGTTVGEWYQNTSAQSGGKTWTFSIWLKGAVGGEVRNIILRRWTDWVTIATNALTLTTDWVRYVVTGTDNGANPTYTIYCDMTGGTTGDTHYAWGAQLEEGYPTIYQKTDDAIDHLNSEYGFWATRGSIGGTMQNPLVELTDTGIKISYNASSKTGIGNNEIGIGHFTGSANSSIKITNTGTNSTSGLYGYTSTGLESFALKLDGTAQIASWSFDNTRFAKGSVTMSSATETLKMGATSTFGTGTGVLLGKDGSDYEFYAGNGTDFIWWNGSALLITGTVTASGGKIGGWDINTTSLTGGSITLSSTGFIEVGNLSSATDTADASTGVYIDNSGNFLAKAGAANTGYIQAASGDINIRSANFHLSASNIFADSGNNGRINLGPTAATITVENTTAGVAMSGSGGFKLYQNPGNYLRFNGGVLDIVTGTAKISGSGVTINTDTFRLDATNLDINPPTITLGEGNIVLDGTAASTKITINNSTFGADGIQLDDNGGNPRFYVGGGGTNPGVMFDGSNLMITSSVFKLTAAGNVIMTGSISASSGHIGGWNMNSYSLRNSGWLDSVTTDTLGTGIILSTTVGTPSPSYPADEFTRGLTIGNHNNGNDTFKLYIGRVADVAPMGTWSGASGTSRFTATGTAIRHGIQFVHWSYGNLFEISCDALGAAASFRAHIAGWNFTTDALYTGTKQTLDTYTSSPGYMTISASGAIYANNFYISKDGSAYLKGFISSSTGHIGGFTIASDYLGYSPGDGIEIKLQGTSALPALYVGKSDGTGGTSNRIYGMLGQQYWGGSWQTSYGMSVGYNYAGGNGGYPVFAAGRAIGGSVSLPVGTIADGTAYMHIGGPTSYAAFDGSTFSVKGTISSSAGHIGGWTIYTNYLQYITADVDITARPSTTNPSVYVGKADGTGRFYGMLGKNYWAGSWQNGYGVSVGYDYAGGNGGYPVFAAGRAIGGSVSLPVGTIADGTIYLHIGSSTSYAAFDGTTFSVKGTISASAGHIGGWTINSDKISKLASTYHGIKAATTSGNNSSATTVFYAGASSDGDGTSAKAAIYSDGTAKFANGEINLNVDGTITGNPAGNNYFIERTRLFGDGSDGDATIQNGTTTITRDMYYDNLTIQYGSSAGILQTNGYRVFVRNTLRFAGSIASGSIIRNNGSNGTTGGTGDALNGYAAGGSAGSGGGGGAGGTLQSGSSGAFGGLGGDANPSIPSADSGTAGSAAVSLAYSITTGTGQAGDAGNSGTGAGAATGGGGGASSAASSTAVKTKVESIDPHVLITMRDLYGNHEIPYRFQNLPAGSGGGGGGGAAKSGAGAAGGGGGGGGGGAGGQILISARKIILANNYGPYYAIQANGGNGGAGGTGGNYYSIVTGGDGGDAGAGAGGVVVIVTSDFGGASSTLSSAQYRTITSGSGAKVAIETKGGLKGGSGTQANAGVYICSFV